MITRQRTTRRLSPALLAAAFTVATSSAAYAQEKPVTAATPTTFVGSMGTSA